MRSSMRWSIVGACRPSAEFWNRERPFVTPFRESICTRIYVIFGIFKDRRELVPFLQYSSCGRAVRKEVLWHSSKLFLQASR